MTTIAQQLNIQQFPFRIKDSKGNQIYYEYSNGYWCRSEFDSNGNTIYSENSYGFWIKREYNSKGKEIYFENSDGRIIDKRPKQVVELTMEELVQRLGYEVKIKK